MTLFVDMYGIFSDDYKHIVRIHWKPWKGSFRFAPPRGPTYALYKKKKMKTFCFGLRRILHSESDFAICWSSRHTSPCEGLMKRQACFRFHQNAQHALWCLWWSGTTLHFERNLWSPGARCISCVSSRKFGEASVDASAHSPLACSAPFLPLCCQSRIRLLHIGES